MKVFFLRSLFLLTLTLVPFQFAFASAEEKGLKSLENVSGENSAENQNLIEYEEDSLGYVFLLTFFLIAFNYSH